MNSKSTVSVVAVCAAFLTVVGVALAYVGRNDDGPTVRAPVGDVIAEGVAPSGSPYKLSHVDAGQGSTMFCYALATEAASAKGCRPVPDRDGNYLGRPVIPSRTLLGTDRFVSTLAPEGVEGMRVVGPDGLETARSIEVEGVGLLLLATIGGSKVTSERPDPERTVEFLDADGKVVRKVTVPGSVRD